MGYYTDYTTRWLDRRYAELDDQGRYYAHMPIYGLNHPCCENGHLARFARLFQVLRELNQIDFESCLDIGGGEGYLSHVVRQTFGASVVSGDLSTEACTRAWDLFEVDAVAIDSARLPFPDNSFDVVICSEVVEHVEFAVECLLELSRVARKAVILSTEELEQDRAEIERHLFRRCGYPHHERNLFHPDDLRLLFGEGITMRSQFIDRVPAGELSIEEAGAWITEVTAVDEIVPEGRGVVMRYELAEGCRRPQPLRSDAELLDGMLRQSDVPDAPLSTDARAEVRPELVKRCVCPITGAPLQAEDGALVTDAGRRYDVRNGIPLLYDLTAADPTEADLRERLATTWPDAPQRIDRAVALRATLVLPFDPERLEWKFAKMEDRRGWMPAESMTGRDGDVFSFTATDDDPSFASPGLRMLSEEFAVLNIRMRTFHPGFPVDAGVGQVFWMTDEDTTLTEDRSFTFPVRNEDKVNDYRVDLSQSPNWPRHACILFLRIDPANGPCEIDLHAVSIERR